MAKYRQLHTSFWQDGFVLDLTPEEKYFYLYIMTNSKTTQCGIYELPKRIIETETGYNRETVQKLLQRFVDYRKIDYHEGTKELMIHNWVKYNPPNNTNAIKCVTKELTEVKNVEFARLYMEIAKENGYELEGLIRGLQGATYTLPSNKVINNKEEIRSNKQEVINDDDRSEKIPFDEVVKHLNDKAGTNYKSSSSKTKDLIKARWNDKFTLEDFKTVIDKKCAEWLGTDMQKFLRPETLFGTKFEGYLNQKISKGVENGASKQSTTRDNQQSKGKFGYVPTKREFTEEERRRIEASDLL